MEAKLWQDKKDRVMLDNLADLYAIIKATEKLEKAYVQDLVSCSDYETECLKLIAQFRTLSSALRDSVPSVDRFVDAYKLDCPAALNRLLSSGVPATVEHRAHLSSSAAPSAPPASAAHVAECVQHFITAMDSLKLNMVAVDQIYHFLTDISATLTKVVGLGLLPPDFEGRAKVADWLAQLRGMRAADELNEQQNRQLSFDLESSYNAFKAAISPSSKISRIE